jgi:hypothetical protein
MIFDLTRQGIKPMIYRTRGKHANHYTTDVFVVKYKYNNIKLEAPRSL